MRRRLVLLATILLPLLCTVLGWGIATEVRAATTANITITASLNFVAISCNGSSYNFGAGNAGSTVNLTVNHFTIDNTSSVQTDQTISVNTTTWVGGTAWTHSDTGTAGADTVGLIANKGTWGTSDIVVEYEGTAMNFIAENQAANTDYSFGLGIRYPTSGSDGVAKTAYVKIAAVAG